METMHVISTVVTKHLHNRHLIHNNTLQNIKLLHVSDLAGPSSAIILITVEGTEWSINICALCQCHGCASVSSAGHAVRCPVTLVWWSCDPGHYPRARNPLVWTIQLIRITSTIGSLGHEVPVRPRGVTKRRQLFGMGQAPGGAGGTVPGRSPQGTSHFHSQRTASE